MPAWGAVALGANTQVERAPGAYVARTRRSAGRILAAVPLAALGADLLALPLADPEVVPLPAKVAAVPAGLVVLFLARVLARAHHEIRVRPGRVIATRRLLRETTRTHTLAAPTVRLTVEHRRVAGDRDQEITPVHVVRVSDADADVALVESADRALARREALALAALLRAPAHDEHGAPLLHEVPKERSLLHALRTQTAPAAPVSDVSGRLRYETTPEGARITHGATRLLIPSVMGMFGLAALAGGLVGLALLGAAALVEDDALARAVAAIFLVVPAAFVFLGARMLHGALALTFGRLVFDVRRGRLVSTFHGLGRATPAEHDLAQATDLRWDDAKKAVVLVGLDADETLSLPIGDEDGRRLAETLRHAIGRYG